MVAFLVTLLLWSTAAALNTPQDLCVEKPIPTAGSFYVIETNVSDYRWSSPVQVTIKPRNPLGPPISEVFLYVPETDPQSPNSRLDVTMLGTWKPDNGSSSLLCMNSGSSGLSFMSVIAGQMANLQPDAIQSANPLELKMNITAVWMPPTSQYDFSSRTGVQFVAYVSPDPNHHMRRWYIATSMALRNRDQLDIALNQKMLSQWWASLSRRLESLAAK